MTRAWIKIIDNELDRFNMEIVHEKYIEAKKDAVNLMRQINKKVNFKLVAD